MKAVVCTGYGPPEVLKQAEVEKPTPKNDEVLIRIHASAVTASDIFIRSSQLPLRFLVPMRILMGFTKPRKSVIGLVLSGTVESVGNDIHRFRPGDDVYGITGFGLGAYAEYTCMKETDSPRAGCVSAKPTNLSHEEATAAAYGGLLALQYMEKGHIRRGHKVLIYGASGTSGTIAVQIAKHRGAHVTAVCGTKNVDFVRALGADTVIDYTAESSFPPGEKYDFALDAVGRLKRSTLKEAIGGALSSSGKYASIDDGSLELQSKPLLSLKQLIEEGHIKPVIDRSYPLEEIAEAHRYVESGHKRGGVAITI